MKRLSIMTSESDSDDFDISKIKKLYKSKKNVDESSSRITKTDKKKKKVDLKNQMTLESSFSNAKSTKKATTNSLEQYFQKKPLKHVKEEITATEFFSSAKKSKPSEPDTFTNLPNNSPTKFVKEKSPIHEPIKTSTVITPVKIEKLSTSLVESPMSASKRTTYASYLNRQGPSALGSKSIPEGAPNCLVGMTFVMTGVLDSIERDDAQQLIEKYGGRVTKALSGKTSYLVVGSDPGETKIKKAATLKTKQINEDELFDLIRTSSTKTGISIPKTVKRKTGKSVPDQTNAAVLTEATDIVNVMSEIEVKAEKKSHRNDSVKQEPLSGKPMMKKADKFPISSSTEKSASQLLVDKYKPVTIKQIVGQQGDRSPANKLSTWLKNWHENYQRGFIKNGEGDHFRGVLLSGSPGIGKTTTAHVVCHELGFRFWEYNASSSRSKTHLLDVVALTRESNAQSWNKDYKFCVIMDEVDGMSGNEDRGGISELMSIIKNSTIPIICICNDRQGTKMRSISNQLYDLKFRQLTLEQIKAAMKSVAFKEKIPIPDDALNEIIQASNFDLRQVLNNLHMWSASSMDSEQIKSEARAGHKEFKLAPFDVASRVFSHEHCKTFNDKLDLFFEDYNLIGLFVQENYLNVQPSKSKNQVGRTLELMALAADSIAKSDIVSRKLRTTNDWGLLPLQGMYASVLPGEYLHGRLTTRIQFPSWLGKFSNYNKRMRIASSLCSHMQNSTRGGASNPAILAMDYGPVLVNKILKPLREGDIETTLGVLNEMNLLREDVDLLVEMTSWSDRGDQMATVSSQIKAALTRAYNKANFKVPYQAESVKKNKAPVTDDFMEDETGDALDQANDENDDEKEDDLIRDSKNVKKTTKSKQPTSSKAPKTKRPAEGKAIKEPTTKKTKNK